MVPEILRFTYWSWWRYQATPTFDDAKKLRPVIELATLYLVAKPQLNRTFGSWDLTFIIWSWWRHQATPTFGDVTKIGPVADLTTLYRPAKFQLSRTFGSWDIDILILKLMTSSGHAHFRWRHKNQSGDRSCHPTSACKVSTQSDIWFLRYWHSHFEVDNAIRSLPLMMTS